MDKEKKLKKLGILLIVIVTLTANVFAADRLGESSTNSNTVIDANYYIVEFEIKQSHFSLDISEHLKDNMNKLTFEVPVDKDYYNKVYVGQEITNSFRVGSFVMKGSIGKWKIIVRNKYTKHK